MTRIVAVGYGTDNTSVVTTSDTDGVIWTTRSTPLDGGLMRDVIYDSASAQFIAVGASPDYQNGLATQQMIQTSPDGLVWTARATPLDGEAAAGWPSCWGVAAGNGLIVVAVSSALNDYSALVSSDGGVTWSGHPLPFNTGAGGLPDVTDIAFGGGTFILLGSNTPGDITAPKAWTSTDGVTWAAMSSNSTGVAAKIQTAARYHPAVSRWSICGFYGSLNVGTPPVDYPVVWDSPDPASWVAHEVYSSSTCQAIAIDWASGPGVWVAQIDMNVISDYRIFTSPDLTTWTPRQTGRAPGNGDVLWTGTSVLVVENNNASRGDPTILRSTDALSYDPVTGTPFDYTGAGTFDTGLWALAIRTPPAPTAPGGLWNVGKRRT